MAEERALIDKFGRKVTDLRVSVTDRCNLRCTYCMPPDGVPAVPRKEILTYEEIIKLSTILVEMGINKIRITGGEPLVRHNLPRLIERLRAISGVKKIPMTTNAILLSRHASELKRAGLSQLNVSLDTLRPERFHRITRFDMFHKVMEGIAKAKGVGLPIRINVVSIRGVNDDETLDFVRFAVERDLTVRFIEFMPFVENRWDVKSFIPSKELIGEISREYKLIPVPKETPSETSEMFTIEGRKGRIGFIPSLTNCFCASCSRLRLTAEGYLKPCLHSEAEVDIKTPLRAGAGDGELRRIIIEAIQLKPLEHGDFLNARETLTTSNRSMVKIGG